MRRGFEQTFSKNVPKISYYLPKARTNYGKLSIHFFGAKVWNSIEESLKSKSHTCFKILLKESLISNYWLAHWCTLFSTFCMCTSPCLLLFVCASVWVDSKSCPLFYVKDVCANRFCASLLRKQIHMPRHAWASALSHEINKRYGKWPLPELCLYLTILDVPWPQ